MEAAAAASRWGTAGIAPACWAMTEACAAGRRFASPCSHPSSRSGGCGLRAAHAEQGVGRAGLPTRHGGLGRLWRASRVHRVVVRTPEGHLGRSRTLLLLAVRAASRRRRSPGRACGPWGPVPRDLHLAQRTVAHRGGAVLLPMRQLGRNHDDPARHGPVRPVQVARHLGFLRRALSRHRSWRTCSGPCCSWPSGGPHLACAVQERRPGLCSAGPDPRSLR